MSYDQLFLQPQLITDREIFSIFLTNNFRSQRTQSVLVLEKKFMAKERKFTYGFG